MAKLKDLFRKHPVEPEEEDSVPETADSGSPSVPAGLWVKCPKCGKMIYRQDVSERFYSCPKCGGYFRIKTKTRIRMVADGGTFEEWGVDIPDKNPLDFPGYEEKLGETRVKTHLREAVTIGKARILGEETVLGVCDARFFMGSMGYVVGERITQAFEKAADLGLPVVMFCCSGGARMQEGMVSLMQMAKTSAAIRRHSDAGLFYLAILTDPTMGGVTASFAMLGDIILAEPGTLIGFAGPRVIAQTIGGKLPEGFQRAEFLLKKGMLDGIVERSELRAQIGRLLAMHRCPSRAAADIDGLSGRTDVEDAAPLPERAGEADAAPLRERTAAAVDSLPGRAGEANAAPLPERPGEADAAPLPGQTAAPYGSGQPSGTSSGSPLSPWERVELSRSAGRPTSLDYIRVIFDDFQELHGDRSFRDDPAVVGGLAWLDGRAVTVIGQQKGRNTKENITRNFAMASPEGYRKALRLMRQAEKFGRPVICFVDTPGAACGVDAEERGQGEAIAQNLQEMAGLKVPVLSVVIGEGGSGGALALAVANEVWMLENATYSILSPEGFASILWKDGGRAKEAAGVMKLTAEDLKELGIIERVIPESIPAGEENLPEIAGNLKKDMKEFLERTISLEPEELARKRYERFRKF